MNWDKLNRGLDWATIIVVAAVILVVVGRIVL